MGRLPAIYVVVRRWVDARFSSDETRQGDLVVLPVVILVLPLWFAGSMPILAACGVVIALAWLWFVSWRAWRLIRTASIKDARDYDRRGKFLIPPEYATSESHFAHHRRKRLR
ncbi:MAG TPA: hypothetical protein VLJ13_04175 [Brevundimonas sp.]|nr:hypothetical protein [Brevundimonas sp.]